MLVKVIIVFLCFMVLVALIGRALFPSALPRILQPPKPGAKCKRCGRPQIGTKPCDCRGRA
jgi:hypothetical protein